jgi:exopolysaccharide biosynthesis polyprenyl glycosylphosphotransferase
MTYFDLPQLFSFEEFLSMRIKVYNFLVLLGIAFGWGLIVFACRLYQSSCMSTRWIRESVNAIKAFTLLTLLLWLFSWFFKIEMMSPFFLLIFWFSSIISNGLGRFVVKRLLEATRLSDRNLRYTLIVGTNERAQVFAHKILKNPKLGYRFVGFVDEKWVGNGELEKNNWKLVANFNNFTDYINKNVVDEVVIALPLKSCYREASEIISASEEQGIMVRNLSDLFNLKISRSRAEHFDGHTMVSHYSGYVFGWKAASKRCIDIVVSGLLLILLFPLFFTVAICIRISSKGDAFFIQDRIGLNKRVFKLYKFRTMVQNAEKIQKSIENMNEFSGPAFKIKDDPRVTKIGKFLRSTSIDELPQLINVFKGDMSLVGPRPLPIRDYNFFEINSHRRRFSVPPGITCLWQVNGRNDIPFEKWMELDMEYIDKWNLFLDFRILFKTIPAVLKRSGAS